MNGFQRIDAALNGRWPDLRPVMLHNFMMAAREAGFTMRQYYSSAKNASEAHIRAVEKYNLDGVAWDIDTAVLASAVGVPVDFPENEPARTHLPLLENLDTLDELEVPDLSSSERVRIAVEGMKLLKRHFGDEKFLRGNADQAPFSLASMKWGPAGWMTDLVLSPDRAHQLLRYCTDVVRQFADLLAGAGADMISNGDSPAGPVMISPDHYREFALPYEREIAAHAHALGLPYMLHICGDTSLILEDMATVGIDAVELDYETDLRAIHSCMSHRITLSGTIDPSGIIAHGNADQVEARAAEILDLYRESPRLIMNAGCAIPPHTPEANIRRLVEVTRAWG